MSIKCQILYNKVKLSQIQDFLDIFDKYLYALPYNDRVEKVLE